MKLRQRYLRMVRTSYRLLRHKRLRHRLWWRKLTLPLFDRQLWRPCRDTVASALAIGFFFAMMLMPFQMIAAAIVAMRFRANIPFAMLGCWISNVFTNVPIWLAQKWLGDWMRDDLGFPMPGFLAKVHFSVPEVGQVNAASFILGMFFSGILLVIVSYPLIYLLSAIMPHYLPVLKPVEIRKKLRRDAE